MLESIITRREQVFTKCDILQQAQVQTDMLSFLMTLQQGGLFARSVYQIPSLYVYQNSHICITTHARLKELAVLLRAGSLDQLRCIGQQWFQYMIRWHASRPLALCPLLYAGTRLDGSDAMRDSEKHNEVQSGGTRCYCYCLK